MRKSREESSPGIDYTKAWRSEKAEQRNKKFSRPGIFPRRWEWEDTS